MPNATTPHEGPTRAAGLERLDRFVPRAGGHYRRERNYDRGPERRENVSGLSPWIRHRLVTEEEVVGATLRRHGAVAAEKFVQEVCWRTYWKGWLEGRPSIWASYRAALDEHRSSISENRRLADRLRRATAGETGIACFDAWARELSETGYLHNHARMWFASIWIFTLRLPWELGADHFLQHLLDGDPAVNTLSWRWVAGRQTSGKHYVATAANIARFTDGRFDPAGDLAEDPPEPPPIEHPAASPIRAPATDATGGADALWLLTDDDLSPETWFAGNDIVPPLDVIAADTTAARSPAGVADGVRAFTRDAFDDALGRCRGMFDLAASPNPPFVADPDAVARRAAAVGAHVVVTPFATVGPNRAFVSALASHLEPAGIRPVEVLRPWDRTFWPHASRGFFRLRKRIPEVLGSLGLDAGADGS